MIRIIRRIVGSSIAGAFVAAALSLALLALGTGVGLSADFTMGKYWRIRFTGRLGSDHLAGADANDRLFLSGDIWRADCVPNGLVFTPTKSISGIPRMVFLSGRWDLLLRRYFWRRRQRR